MNTWFDLLREKLSWGAHGTVDVLPRDFACYLMAGIPQPDARRVARSVLAGYLPVIQQSTGRRWARLQLSRDSEGRASRRFPTWPVRQQDLMFVEGILSFRASGVKRPLDKEWLSVYQLTCAVDRGIGARAVNAWASDDPVAAVRFYRTGEASLQWGSEVFHLVRKREWLAVLKEFEGCRNAFDVDRGSRDGGRVKEAWDASEGSLLFE